MDTEGFFWLLSIAFILFVPLAWIYFILYTLNWDQRKNLFSDSWIIFITLLISSFAVIFVFLLADANFYRYFYLVNPVTFFLLIVLANIFSIVAVLTSRVKKNLSIAADLNEEEGSKPDISKIWQTSVIVTLLNLAMVVSLVMFVKDITTRLEKPKPTPEFGIYD